MSNDSVSDDHVAGRGQGATAIPARARPAFGRLSSRMVMVTLLISGLMSLISTGIQVYSAYNRDRAYFLSEFDNVKLSFQRGLESALWEFDSTQVDLLLGGILAQRHMEYVSLESATGEEWVLGTDDPNHEVRTFELMFKKPDGEQVPVGTLTAHLSLANVWVNIRQNVLTILLTSFAKAFGVAYVLLIVFERLFVRHLNFIASFVASNPLREGAAPLSLPRSRFSQPDEFDLIVSALNKANAQITDSFELLRKEQKTVEDTNRRLFAANQEQSDFTYAVSHDLKSPLNTIKMLVKELEEEAIGGNSEDCKELLDEISKTLARANGRIAAITAYSQTVEPKQEYTLLDVDALVQGVLKDLQHDISVPGARVEVGPLGQYRGNEFQIRMMMQNLIGNGLKYQQPGNVPRLQIRGDDATAADPDQLIFEIEDNGIGIAPEHRERVFGLFSRLHSDAEYEGSGLGLAVVNRVVHNNNGSISVRAARKGGSVFRICLASLRSNRGEVL